MNPNHGALHAPSRWKAIAGLSLAVCALHEAHAHAAHAEPMPLWLGRSAAFAPSLVLAVLLALLLVWQRWTSRRDRASACGATHFPDAARQRRWLRGLSVVLAVMGGINAGAFLFHADQVDPVFVSAIVLFNLAAQVLPAYLLWRPGAVTWPLALAGALTTLLSFLPLLWGVSGVVRGAVALCLAVPAAMAILLFMPAVAGSFRPDRLVKR